MSPTLLALVLLSTFVSAVSTYAIVRFPGWHAAFSADPVTRGAQKFHVHATPRIGGVPIAAAFALAIGCAASSGAFGAQAAYWMVLLTALPVLAVGLLEDTTKRVEPSARLVVMAIAALVATVAFELKLTRLDLPLADGLLAVGVVSVVFTSLALVGVANAFNIIDGYNGLVGVVAMIVLLGLASVAWTVGDAHILAAAVVLAGTIGGFLVWNYPNGRIFAGDGGAYFIGWVIAVLSILLVERNAAVSPWLPLALTIYPVWETLFSIYRKKILRGRSPTQPDALHFHMLVYRRLARFRVGSRDSRDRLMRNSLTSPYLWALTSLSVVPAVAFWNHTAALQAVIAAFVAVYVSCYFRMVRFRAPRWLVMNMPAGKRAVRALSKQES